MRNIIKRSCSEVRVRHLVDIKGVQEVKVRHCFVLRSQGDKSARARVCVCNVDLTNVEEKKQREKYERMKQSCDVKVN